MLSPKECAVATNVQLCSKRMGRLVVVTNVSFNERFTRVNSMRSKAMQC